MNPSSDRSGADWIAWVLQVAFGAFIGGLFGLGLIAQRRSGFWLSADVIAVYLWGAALVGAGLSGLHGGRLWFAGRVRVIPPEAPTHSLASAVLAWVILVGGAGLVGFALVVHFGWIARP